jgi:hypothetical protein
MFLFSSLVFDCLHKKGLYYFCFLFFFDNREPRQLPLDWTGESPRGCYAVEATAEPGSFPRGDFKFQ